MFDLSPWQRFVLLVDYKFAFVLILQASGLVVLFACMLLTTWCQVMAK